MTIEEFYAGKNVFITGTTGFVGKVLLEKILYALPRTGTIYVLIRNKKGSSVEERLKKEIMESNCFDRLRKKHPNFDELFMQKVKPIFGDLLKEGLDLSKEDEELIKENVNIFINSAASVDFNARLDEAIKNNILGSLRVYGLAKKARNLINFIHISTGYVNCNRRGYIEEIIYPYPRDPQEVVNEMLRLPVEELVKKTTSFLGDYPNTYTFTKSLTERILEKEKGQYPVTIVRPTIIGSSWRDPHMGWVDTVSAAGALYLLGGIGILKNVQGKKSNIGDQIPVDYVVDFILVAAAYTANDKSFWVFNCGSSDRNPVTWGFSSEVVLNYWNAHPSEKSVVDKVTFELIENRQLLQLAHLKRKIPAYIYFQYANKFGDSAAKKKGARIRKVLDRAESIGETFKHFTMNQWVFSTNKIDKLISFLNEGEREVFQLDISQVKWPEYLLHFGWGLHRYVLKENVDSPSSVSRYDVLSKGKVKEGYFNDIQWALNHGKEYETLTPKHAMEKVLSSPNVQEIIKKQGEVGKRKATEICKIMFADYNIKVMRFFAWFLHKSFKTIFDKIVIDENQIKLLKELESRGPLILIPNHISYIDFLVVSYIFFAYNLRCPHINGTEDFLNITFVHRILRASGAFFSKKNKKHFGELYEVILAEYLKTLLEDNCNIELFIDISRTRSGKITKPKNEVLNIFLKTILNKQNLKNQRVENMHLVPISISYERVLEGETFPLELLGEEKVKENLMRMIRSIGIFKMKFGRIFVEFCTPINIKNFLSSNNQSMEVESQMELIRTKITKELNNKSFIMPTSLVAAVILMNRKGINEEVLLNRCELLVQELLKREKKIGSVSADSPQVIPVKAALNLLSNLINKKKDMFRLSITPREEYRTILLLSYYKNSILSHLLDEAKIACALVAFGHQIAWKEGIVISRLFEEAAFLDKLFELEFVGGLISKDTLERMIRLKVVSLDEKKEKIKVADDFMIKFLCSLLWPFIETYWASSVYLFSLKNVEMKQGVQYRSLLQQIQWFCETMHEERVLEHYESCSQDTIKHSIKLFRDWKFLNKDSKTKKYMLDSTEERLKDLENHLKSFTKSSFAKTVDSPIEIARKSMLIDYPFMTKL